MQMHTVGAHASDCRSTGLSKERFMISQISTYAALVWDNVGGMSTNDQDVFFHRGSKRFDFTGTF